MRFVCRLTLLLVVGFLPALASSSGRAAEDAATSFLQAAAPASRVYPALFGTREAYSSDNSAFFKWTGMLARFHAELQNSQGPCTMDRMQDCVPTEWSELIGELHDLDARTKAVRVNQLINGHPYIPSMRNWGEINHWETPFEFLRKSGQCQDYAITKYMLLRASGVAAERLRVVVLHDAHLGLDHAVTVIYIDGTALMLDNQLRDVVSVDTIQHYQPYYSINEQGWWLHRGPNARYASSAERSKVE
jgi:predicted transglutaminase-like cysteine proteinase